MKFNKKDFKDNFKFLLSLFFIVIIYTVISLSIGSEETIKNKDLSNKLDSNIHKLVINEVMSSNGGVLVDETGEKYDWIELYNGSEKDIELNNYGLSDKDNEVKWVFPEVTIKSKSYLVIFLIGSNKEGLYGSFNLSSGGGETLSLRNPNGKVIDAFKTEKIDKNFSFIKDENGVWHKTSKPTPGFENSERGYSEFQASLLSKESNLKITEVLPYNKGNFVDKYDQFTGYIEITNVSDKTVNTKDYLVSDSETVPFKWKLPDKKLEPNEVIVIYTTNNNVNDEYYADFKLNSNNGYAVLSKNDGTVADKVKYENLANGQAMVKIEGKFYETANISPGYPNNSSGSEKYANEFLKTKDELVINEVMNLNSKYIAQNGGQYYDWIELKNNSNKTINLSGYYLSNDINDKNMWELPDIELKPNAFITVIASKEEYLTNNKYHHTNFKLSNNDGVFLIKGGKITDSVFLYDIPADYSYGRGKSGFFYMSKPTPGAENNTGYREISYTPEVLTLPGVFNNVNNIKISILGPGNIYYTTDGNDPNKTSKLYTGEITLKKTTVLKAVSYENGKRVSEVSTNSYIINEGHTIPVMSLSMNPGNFDYITRNRWTVGLETEAYVELYENNKSFSIPCGFRLFGGSTRGHPKQSFALKFKKRYGESELKYKVFDSKESARYNSLVLRSGSQDYQNAMIRDELGTSIVDGVTNLDVQAYKAVILYINAEYWGIYYIREKVDEEFISNHYNVSSKGTNIVRIDGDVTVGSSSEYNKIVNYVKSHDMKVDSNYKYIESKINIDSLIDYWIAATWVANNDIVNTRFFSNPKVNDGKWGWIFYDLDFAFYNEDRDYIKWMTNPSGMVPNPQKSNVYSTALLSNLMKNKKFKSRFVERLSYNLNNVWTEKRINDKMELLYNTILPEMIRNQKRWNSSMKKWYEEIDELKDFLKVRRKYLLKHIKSYFSLSDKEMKKYFGGS